MKTQKIIQTTYDGFFITKDDKGNICSYEGLNLCPDSVKEQITNGNFEKVGDLPWELPRNDETITTGPGDVILYQGDQITIYYDENTWDFTRLARIEDVSREELLEAFGVGDVTVRFWVEWSE